MSGATDEENLDKLLREVPGRSGAAYVCAMAYVDPASGERRDLRGRCGGVLAATRAATGGFGYDPAFLPAERADGRTMAELSHAEKDAISHRGRAARALLAWLS